MKGLSIIVIILVFSVLLSSCVTTTSMETDIGDFENNNVFRIDNIQAAAKGGDLLVKVKDEEKFNQLLINNDYYIRREIINTKAEYNIPYTYSAYENYIFFKDNNILY